VRPEFWQFFGVVSLLLVLWAVTVDMVGETQPSTACAPRGTTPTTPSRADSSKRRRLGKPRGMKPRNLSFYQRQGDKVVQRSTFSVKLREFMVRPWPCVITLALLSVSFFCALAQKGHPPTSTSVQESTANALVSTGSKSTESFEDVSVARGEGYTLPGGGGRPSDGRMEDSAPQDFAQAVGWSSRLSSGWTSSGDLSIGSFDPGSGPGAGNRTE
jgi:hypothetical protein